MPPIVAHAEGGTLPASALDFLEGRSVTPLTSFPRKTHRTAK
jgi:hypothetical protein